MDLQKHYETYRNSVRQDDLGGISQYIIKMEGPQGYSSMSEFVKHSKLQIDKAIDGNREDYYIPWLKAHQQALLTVFCKKTAEEIDERAKKITAGSATFAINMTALNLVHERDWRWFKFSPIPLEWETMVWIPRYSKGMRKQFVGKKSCWDADELGLIFTHKPSPNWVKEMQQIKRKKAIKIFQRGENLIALDVHNLNKTFVEDWTVELFP